MVRVMIRTRPLGQGNYGGILQAYALQRVLESLGLAPTTDVSTGRRLGRRPTQWVRTLLKSVLVRAGVPSTVRTRWVAEVIGRERDAELIRFVSDQIHTGALYDESGNVRDEMLDDVDAFVVGSDQVWRPAFGRLPSYLFDFLAVDDHRPRIAYAASFGTDEIAEFTPDLVAQTKPLARQFDHVSVREASGVDLCRDMWGVDALHVLDPTMLLAPDHYRTLSEDATPYSTEGGLCTYLLDAGPTVERQVESVEEWLGHAASPLLPELPLGLSDYRRAPERYTRPTVEQWLVAIDKADFIVTDSFHGTVFAVLFQTPFVTIVNRARGAARFRSLLAGLGLGDRLLEPGEPVTPRLIQEEIPWESVRARIDAERQASMAFLRRSFESFLAETDEPIST